jgi:RNA polymerase sigma-70 factor (ECF subfamily)
MTNERHLVEACIRNERTAQRQLYELFASKFYAIAVRYMKDEEDAADVLQDTFVKVFKHVNTFRFDCPFEAWARRILINTALKALQKKKRRGYQVDAEEMTNQLSEKATDISNMALEELMGLIHELPDGCQTIFNLYAIEGYKHHEIADLLDISEGTSKSQYSRAKQILKQKLADISEQEMKLRNL